ncbi:ubiquitin-like domain-containing protein [Peribacillus frigoritolerans]|nr:ubiquitin-like domain-containing protein [Peribacillus frigoritolerans]
MVQDGKKKEVWSTADTVDELLKDQNLSVKEQDKITPSKKYEAESEYGSCHRQSLFTEISGRWRRKSRYGQLRLLSLTF